MEPGTGVVTHPSAPGELYPAEVIWRDNYDFLEASGYRLRSRYKPDWVPSWRGTSRLWAFCEDGLPPYAVHLVDATRTLDAVPVMIKIIMKQSHPYEMEVMQYLSSAKLQMDRGNHSMQLLDVLDPPTHPEYSMLVLPFLRTFDEPPFDTIGEAVDFFSQIFEGLQFLHDHNVAHRDCGRANIMMDPIPLYPNLYHPVKTNLNRDLSGPAAHFTRTERPTRYFFVDFGISRHYPDVQMPVIEDIIDAGDKTVPEHQGDALRANPFRTDIYLLGNMIRQKFLETHRSYRFMQPLVDSMVQSDPARRPTAGQVATNFGTIRTSLSLWTLRSRPVAKHEFWFAAIFRNIAHRLRQLRYMIRRLPAIPNVFPSSPP